MEDVKQPIVIKKINAKHPHHGGSWKVAFADFATAMMAFFMVLWLVGQTDAQQRGGIAEYFQNPSMVPGLSEAPTGAMGPGGASTGLIMLGGTYDPPKKQTATISEEIIDKKEALAKKLELQQEIKRLDAILKNLKESMLKSESLSPYREQLLLNIAPEGLRIQIIDDEDRPMFGSGSAILKPYTAEILYEVARNIRDVPNHISITGHTDSSPYTARRDYSNWELSSDRANAARRALIEGGLKADRVGRVVGLADSIPYDPLDPRAPSNRRINIVVMNQSAYESMAQGEAPPQKTTHALATEDASEKKPNVIYDPGKSTYENIKVEELPSADPMDLDSLTPTGEKKANVIYDPGKSTYENIKVEELPYVDPLKLESQTPFRESNLYAEEPKPAVTRETLPLKESSPEKETRKATKEPRKSNNVIKRPTPVKPVIVKPTIIDPSVIPGLPMDK